MASPPGASAPAPAGSPLARGGGLEHLAEGGPQLAHVHNDVFFDAGVALGELERNKDFILSETEQDVPGSSAIIL